MRCHALIAIKPEEPLSATPSQVTTRQEGRTEARRAQCLPVCLWANCVPKLPPVDINPVGHRSRAHPLGSTPMLPKDVVIGCGRGSGFRALDDIFEFTGVTDHDWIALESARTNGMATSAMFKRTCPGDPDYGTGVKSLKPEVIIGNTSRRRSPQRRGEHSPLVSKTIQARRNASSGGRPD